MKEMVNMNAYMSLIFRDNQETETDRMDTKTSNRQNVTVEHSNPCNSCHMDIISQKIGMHGYYTSKTG